MGHNHMHIRFLLTLAFSTCLIASSGTEMEIIRFSGAYTLTHSERVVQVTESIRRSQGAKKVTKVASLAPVGRKGRGFRTTKEFEMKQKSGSFEKQTFIPTTTQGTVDQDLCRPPHPCAGQWSSERKMEFTATYTDSSPVCQKVSFSLNLSELTQPQKREFLQEEKEILLNELSKPIFFVYPPFHSRGKIEENDDEMDYYHPTFLFEFNSNIAAIYDATVSGGFDSEGENVSMYMYRNGDATSSSVAVNSVSKSSNSNVSSYDELCKALLLDYG
ncbi:unnamed protein product [Orchesella dallaii]|uniref:Uncharacterized protein n=1 Tax=Orchesella dallaii TaxID=48710 RepID=A0ABP1QSP1_9HEXA